MNTPKEPHPAFPSLGQAATIVLILYFFEYVAFGALHDFLDLRGDDLQGAAGIAVLLANAALLTLILHHKQLSYARLFHDAPVSAAATLGLLIVPIALLVPALVLANLAVNTLLISLEAPNEYQQQMFERMMSIDVMSLLYVCVLAPFLEEMLFRGVILRSFLVQYPKGRAIAASAILFGIAHLNAYQFVVGVTIGLVLGWLYERTRSLWPCIALHALYNAASVALTVMYANNAGKFGSDISIFAWMGAFALALVGALGLKRLVGERL